MPFWEQLLLAFGGLVFHLLKMWYSAVKRNEEFVNKSFYIWVAMNIVGSTLLVYVGNELPAELIVMSPITCIVLGAFGSSTLSGFINVKKPKNLDPNLIDP